MKKANNYNFLLHDPDRTKVYCIFCTLYICTSMESKIYHPCFKVRSDFVYYSVGAYLTKKKVVGLATVKKLKLIFTSHMCCPQVIVAITEFK